MRIVFLGGNKIAKISTKRLTESGHEVIIIEKNPEKIEELSEILDCGFIHGNGTRPDILKEADPKNTDVLICGTEDDHANIIASLLAKSLEFRRVITMISEVELETICANLGLGSTIFSAKTISDYLQELLHGRDVFEVSAAMQGDLRLYMFKAKKDHAKPVKEFKLPPDSQIVWLYRRGQYEITNENTVVQENDMIVIATHQNHLEELGKTYPR